MKILFLQDHARSGGAARAAARWADLLRARGHLTLGVAGDAACASGYHLTGKPPRGWGRLREVLTARRKRREEKVRQEFSKILEREQPDLVWCHNLAGGQKWGWGEFLVTMAREHRPVLWTLHDMWALGNGPASYWHDDKSGKGAEDGERGTSRSENSRLVRICEESAHYPLALTAPSKWLSNMVQSLTGQSCFTLPNPIDLNRYRPGDRKQARNRLGLPDDLFLVLAGADSLADSRKGFDLLQAAWQFPRPPTAAQVLFGRHGFSRKGTFSLGPIVSDARMVDAYQAVNLYVHPARMENASCQIQEAMACGIPTVAFRVGGNPELIAAGQSGFLAPRVAPADLAEELGRAWTEGQDLAAMGNEARKHALAIWSPERLLCAWEGVVESLVSGRKPPRSRG